MNYYKNIENGYIASLQTCDSGSGVEISAEEYASLLTLIKTKPSAPDGYDYMLRADTLEWELVELPPEPTPEEEATAEDYENALEVFGV